MCCKSSEIGFPLVLLRFEEGDYRLWSRKEERFFFYLLYP